jgi:acetyl-CoA acyltransferase 2
MLKQVFVVGAKRTPFGKFGGALKGYTPVQMGAEAAKAALASANVAPELVDSCCVGNVAQTDTTCAYMARHIALHAGVPVERPALTVNRLCGSGFQSIITAAQEIQLGESEIVLTGGAESMSQAPFAIPGASRWGNPLGKNIQAVDTLWETLTDSYIKLPMGITGENLAEEYSISKEACDEWALRSHAKWEVANAGQRFAAEMAPITLKTRKGEVVMDTDEGPRAGATLESFAKLKPVFKKDGVITAANASQITDGAGAVVVASEDAVANHSLTPMARVVAYHVSGCDPKVMGIGPVPAIQGALSKAGLSMDDMDLVEINEAFAPQYLACQQALGFDPERANTNGGAIAIGHPTGASGARIMGHLAHELVRTGKRYAVGSACIGGGQGIAIILERA